MSEKQIFAGLEVSDHEVRLVVGEFFNNRFNIIKVQRVSCNGLAFNEVKDAESISAAISKAVEETRTKLGADVQKVILALPSYRFKRFSCRSTVAITGVDQQVTSQDIRSAINKAQNLKVPADYAVVQSVCTKYTVNGVSFRKLPIGQKCKELTVELDLFAIDKKLAYELVTAVENAGVQILDIYVDVFAAAEEAALLNQGKGQTVLLKMERESTTLGLLRNGRLSTAVVMPAGLGNIAGALTDKYGIDGDTACELLKYSVKLDTEKCSSNPVHIWNDEGKTRTITEQELYDCVKDYMNFWLDHIQKTCVPILQAGETTVIITGEGGEAEGFSALLSKRLGVNVSTYIPETLGGRNAGLTACLGLFYAYQDRLPILSTKDESLDMNAFEKAVSLSEETQEEKQEGTLTHKIKGLFLEGKK